MATSAVSSTTSANTAAMSTATSGTSTTSAQAASKAAAQKLVTSLGSGSGVDVNALAQNLVDAERIPRQTAIQKKIDKNNARVSGLSAMMYLLSDLKTKLAALKDKSSLSTMTASSSSAALSATAVAGATVGNHTIQINKLASAQRVVSEGFAKDSTLINGGNAFQISITKGKIASGVSSAVNGQPDTISSVSVGSGSDFGGFSVTVDGTSYTVAPATGLKTLAELASDLQTQLQAQMQGGLPAIPKIQVSVDGANGLKVTSSDDSYAITGAELRPATNLEGVRFGDAADPKEFKTFSVVIGGVTRTVTPSPTNATATDLATSLQTLLQATDSDVTVQAITSTSGDTTLKFRSNTGRTISSPQLLTGLVDMTPPAGLSGGTASAVVSGLKTGTPSGNTISGIAMGTPASSANFKAFTVTVDGKAYTVKPTTPAIGSALTDLAADLESQLQAQMGNSDVTVQASGGSLTVLSGSGKTVTSPMLSATSLDGVSFATNNPSTKDFRGFGLTVQLANGQSKPFQIVPNPQATTLEALAADLQSQLRVQDSVSSTSTDLSVTASNGQLQFWSASGRSITNPILLTNTYELTPSGVARAINDKKLGLTAQVVNTGSAQDPYKLVVNSASGANQAFNISANTTTGSLLKFGNTPLSDAADASFVVDGVEMTRSSNTISDAITGVTLNLKSTTPGGLSPTPASLDIGLDTSTLKTKMTDMVSSFNDTWDLLNQVSDPKSTLETYGATLVGDSIVRNVKQQVRGMFQGNSSTPGTSISAFWQMGIKIDEKGVMTFDSTTFETSVQSNYSDVVKSLTGNYDNLSSYSSSPAGFAGDAVRKLSKLLDTKDNGGPILSASENANTQNTKYQEDLTKLQTRMDALLTRYQKQLASMDSLVGSTNSQKTSLKSQFDGMMSVYTKN